MASREPFWLRPGFKMIEWICSIDHLEMVEGDLMELYNGRVGGKGLAIAIIVFYAECASLTYRFISKGKSEFHLNNVAMLKSYFIIGIRNLSRNLSYTLINVLGLAMGIFGAIFIYQYVTNERSFDSQYSRDKKIVRITSEWFQDNVLLEHRAAAVPALEQIFDQTYPEVIRYARYHKGATNVVRFTTKADREMKFEENNIFYADPSFFEIFDIEFIAGSPAHALQGPNKVVITSAIAKKYFGTESPLGKTLKFDGEFNFSCQVTGVVKDFSAKSHLAGDMIISLETKVNMAPFEIYDNWIWRSFYTYLEVRPGTRLSALEDKINLGVTKQIGDYYEQRRYSVHFHVQPVEGIHLSSNLFEELEVNGSAQNISYLSVACLLLLLIGGFNYINLTTAKNLYRVKEIGIRKAVGAYQLNLAMQYLIESLLVFGLAIALSIVLIYFLHPILNSYIQLDMELKFLSTYLFWGQLTLVWLVGGILSGLYPALVLTSMNPAVVLKGSFKNSSGNINLRKLLVIFQLAISLVLIFSVVIITEQVRHMQDRGLGIRKENILVINGPKIKDQNYISRLETFKKQVETSAGVQYMSTVSGLIGEVTGAGRDFTDENGVSQFLRIIRVEYDFEKVMEMPLIAGHTFSEQLPAADSGLILNEAAVRQMGFKNTEEALQQNITWRNVDDSIQSGIIAVVKDYFPSAQSEAVPTVFILNRIYSAPWDPEFYIISLSSSDFGRTLSTINDIDEIWTSTFSADPFNYYFMDSFYDRQFRQDISFSRIMGLFGVLAIFLSCVGILALASYSNFMRLKEIGIRKVLGSSEWGILKLLIKDYVKLIILGALLVFPFAYYFFDNWLSSFRYRIDIQAWHFLVPFFGLLTLVITIVALQSYRTASINPVRVLSAE